ncbi:MAG TPA: RNA 2',3'-cyclic phosphodiesterase [Solirubrobacteraceae bacterium]
MSLRLFVAAELPGKVVQALVDWRPRADALRPVAPEALHVTLAFLGARAEDDVPVIQAGLEHARRPVTALALGEALWLPRRRPRVLAVELDDLDGALGTLQRDVSAGLEEGIGWTPERRPFLAHVTVARVRPGAGGHVPDAGEAPVLGPFPAAALTLFRSHLSPRGARYESLWRATLDSA